MKMYVVSYSIANAQVRMGLEKVLDELEAWWRYIPNTWLVVTDQSPDDIMERVETFLSGPDRILIMEVTPTNRAGWMPQDGWAWLASPWIKQLE